MASAKTIILAREKRYFTDGKVTDEEIKQIKNILKKENPKHLQHVAVRQACLAARQTHPS
jgi:hypothetical protein